MNNIIYIKISKKITAPIKSYILIKIFLVIESYDKQLEFVLVKIFIKFSIQTFPFCSSKIHIKENPYI